MELLRYIKVKRWQRKARKSLEKAQAEQAAANARSAQIDWHPDTIDSFTREEMKQVYQQGVDDGYQLGYPVGRNEGIAFAKEAAIKNLKEVIWQQNKQKTNNQNNPLTAVPSPLYKPSQNSALTNGRELHVPGR